MIFRCSSMLVRAFPHLLPTSPAPCGTNALVYLFCSNQQSQTLIPDALSRWLAPVKRRHCNGTRHLVQWDRLTEVTPPTFWPAASRARPVPSSLSTAQFTDKCDKRPNDNCDAKPEPVPAPSSPFLPALVDRYRLAVFGRHLLAFGHLPRRPRQRQLLVVSRVRELPAMTASGNCRFTQVPNSL